MSSLSLAHISYTQLSRIEGLTANEVKNYVIDCIQDHDNATSVCLEVCEGTSYDGCVKLRR